MAKTSKTVKKPNKKSNKQSKVSNFLSKLSPNSPKKKFLAFAAVFAIAGGGYYAYSSFAATSPIKTYYASDFSLGERSNRSNQKEGKATISVISLVGPDTNNRARITANTREKYSGMQKVCFSYKVSKQNNKPAKARTAFGVYNAANTTKALEAVSILGSSSETYKQECLSFDAGNSKTLQFAMSVWDGGASFTKATIQKDASVVIKAADFSKYTSRMLGTRNITQSDGIKTGQTVTEMYKSDAQILFWLKNTNLNDKLKISKGKKYETCITYAIGDKGSSSDLVVYYPVGTTRVDQQNLDTTDSLSTYKTDCHAFTYNGGNADAVSLHYPSWARSLSSPYKIRVYSIKITQK